MQEANIHNPAQQSPSPSPPPLPSMARTIQDNNDAHAGAVADDSSVNTPIRSNSSNTSISDLNNNTARGVSIAYAAGSGRHPIMSNLANLFHLGLESLEGVFGHSTDGSAEAGTTGNNDENNNGKNRKISCYCIPCLSWGRGERGRSNIRAISTLFFPLFLLSFFLLDDFGRVVMRNIRIRHGSKALSSLKLKGKRAELIHPVLRRNRMNERPGLRRDLMWAPLELTMNIDAKTSVKAKMKCPRGVLFLFHGCGRYAASFFYSPQGRRLVSMAYNAGVAIVAFEKTNEKGCWDWNQDGEAVLKIGRKFVKSNRWGACGEDDNGDVMYPPMWAFGASSGGSFIAMLASEMNERPEKYAPFLFSAINVQIMSPSDSLDWDVPTIFTVMEGDAMTKQRVEERVARKFQGGPFRMIATSGQKSIHANHFSKVYSEDSQMTEAVSRDIYQDLVTMGVVDASNNDMLTANPSHNEDAVASIFEKYDMSVRAAEASLGEDVMPFGLSHQLMQPLRAEELADANNIWLIEELNVAWDQHEITVEGFDEVLSFFFEIGSPSYLSQSGRRRVQGEDEEQSFSDPRHFEVISATIED